MSCNVTQNELGGKELLLKTCVVDTVATTSSSTTLTAVAHGLKVGDLMKFTSVDLLTSVTVDTLYYVKTVPSADTFTISATRTGAAISMDVTDASVAVELYVAVGGLRSKSMSLSSDGIDITSEDSDEWTTLLDGAGIRSMEISGDGVYNNSAVFQGVVTKFLANQLTCLAFVEYKSGRVYSGCFKITSLEITGSHDGEATYSMSASSSGAITTVVIAA